MDATEITIPDNSCNGDGDGLDVTLYTQLKKLTVGDNCFAKLDIVIFKSLYTLESVTIGMNSFNGGNNDPSSKLFIDGCYKLKSFRIGRYSLSNYSHFYLSNVDAMEVLEIGDVNEESNNFLYGSLHLVTSIPCYIILIRR